MAKPRRGQLSPRSQDADLLAGGRGARGVGVAKGTCLGEEKEKITRFLKKLIDFLGTGKTRFTKK